MTASLCVGTAFAEPVALASVDRAAEHRAALGALSEALGEAHAVRRLCEGRGAQSFRDMMFAVLDREGLTESEEGERLIDAFNRGFHRGETAWTRCTPAAEAWQRRASARAQGAADTLASLRPDASTP